MIIGLFFFCLGALLIAAQLFHWSFWYLFSQYWPCFFILWGLIRLLRRRPSRLLSWTMIGVGLVLEGYILEVFQGELGGLIIGVLFLIIGAKIMLETGKYHRRKKREEDAQVFHSASTSTGKPTNSPFIEQDELDDRFLFTNDRRIYRSDTFSGGRVEVDFAQVCIDLKNVISLEREVHMECSVNFGELILEVPRDWHVIVNGKHYYAQDEMDRDRVPTATLLVDSRVLVGNLKIV